MTTKITKNVYIRNDILYVQGSVNKVFRRISTKKQATKLNIIWAKKNWKQVLLNHIENKIKQTQITKDDDMFNTFALSSLELNSSSRSDSTNEEYLGVFNNYIKDYFKYYSIKDMKVSTVKAWQNKLLESDLSFGRIRFIRAVLSGILSDAYYDELIPFNPISKIKLEKRVEDGLEDDDINPFLLEEIQAILRATTGQFTNILTTLFFTGIRTGECWGLKWEDINFINKTITIKRAVRHGVVGKTKTKNSNRVIDMLPIVEDALIRQKTLTMINDSFVFLNRNKNHFQSAQHLSNGLWKKTLKFVGLDYRYMYQTRHSFATLMISNGEDITWVSKTLGHSTIKVTLDAYTKFIPDSNKDRAVFLNEFKVKNCTNTAHTNLRLIKSS